VNQPKWELLPMNFLKINMDAALSKIERRRAAATFCRDTIRNYLGCSCWNLLKFSPPQIVDPIIPKILEAHVVYLYMARDGTKI
jgi:hypothetical protein